METQNEIEGTEPTETTDFLPSHGASCSLSSFSVGDVRLSSHIVDSLGIEYGIGTTIKNGLGMTEEQFLHEIRTESAVMRIALIRRAHMEKLQVDGMQYPPVTFLTKRAIDDY